jgi:mono/diheme cytochrome c family protein
MHCAVHGCARCSLLALFLICAGCGDDREPRTWRASDHQPPSAEETGQQEPGDTSEDSIEQGAAAYYGARCAPCHGQEGRGDGPAMPAGASVDLSGVELQSSRTDDQLFQTIHDGRGMMPAFGNELAEEQIQALVAHIRTLRAD